MLKHLPDVNLLRDLLDYNKDSGEFKWKPRKPEHFEATQARTPEWQCKWWNTRFANTEAGFINQHGYRLIRVDSVDYFAHRLAWMIITGEAPNHIDHTNGVRSDNRWCNLRSVSNTENTRNAKQRTDNVSGVTGVGYYPKSNKWRARINDGKRTILLGYFTTYEEAVAARKAAEKVYGYHANHGRQQP